MSDLPTELTRALRRLSSDDIDERVGAVEDLAHISNRAVDQVVEAFEAPGAARFAIFERLGRFGSLAVDPLEQLLTRTQDSELQVLASAALLALGSRVGVGVLLEAIRADHEYKCVAARMLSDAMVDEAEPVLRQAILERRSDDQSALECLVVALRRLSGSLPEDVRVSLNAVEPAWLRDALLR